MDERQYKQKFAAEERAIQTIYHAFTSYGPFLNFNPYEFTFSIPFNASDDELSEQDD
ncbi:hypothetical protein [Lacrimispora amygdalina]|uniref:hypothetical protein n=1 Tax=Lacrimispora amygdalina TaxID=253257 RepID=UPI0014072382|nr:hypothetical protein [Lacrimispora amygdalina]